MRERALAIRLARTATEAGVLLAFAFSAKKDWRSKVRDDVAKIAGLPRTFLNAFELTPGFDTNRSCVKVLTVLDELVEKITPTDLLKTAQPVILYAAAKVQDATLQEVNGRLPSLFAWCHSEPVPLSSR